MFGITVGCVVVVVVFFFSLFFFWGGGRGVGGAREWSPNGISKSSAHCYLTEELMSRCSHFSHWFICSFRFRKSILAMPKPRRRWT